MAQTPSSHRPSLLSRLWKRHSRTPEDDDERFAWDRPVASIVKRIHEVPVPEDTTAACVQRLQLVRRVEAAMEPSQSGILVTLAFRLRQPLDQDPITSSATSIYQPGIRQLRHQLTRPFGEFRTLRKAITFCVQQKTCKKLECGYCQQVSTYVDQCWEQPALVAMALIDRTPTFRPRVLAGSMLRFIELVQVDQVAAPLADCKARDRIALLLHDFFQFPMQQSDGKWTRPNDSMSRTTLSSLDSIGSRRWSSSTY